MFELIFILAIAFIPMLWVRSANKLTKEMEKAPVVNATVVKCDVVPRNEECCKHYLVTYEYYDAYGVAQYFTERAEKELQVGRVYKKFLIRHTQGYILVDTKALEENKQASVWPLYVWTIGVSAVGILVYMMNHSSAKTEFVIKTGFFVLIGIAMVLAGFFSFKGAFNKRRLLRDPYVREIQGTIVDYRQERTREHNNIIYFPIYECFYNGNVYEYKRSYSTSKVPTVGERSTLYIDTRNNEVFEKGEIKVNLILGFVFGGFGLLALVAIIMGIVNGNLN